MGFGNWIEEREFEYPVDLVFETLLGLVHRSGFKIQSFDSALRGLVAEVAGSSGATFLFGSLQGRLAASVQPLDDSKSMVILEIGPAYDAKLFGHHWYKRHVVRMLNDLTRALEEST